GARGGVGPAVDLEQHADPTAAVDVRHHQAFGRLAAGLLRGLREPLGAQVVDRLVHVTRRLGQRLLAVAHPGAGALAQVLDLGRGDFHGYCSVSGEAEASGLNMLPPVDISTRGPSPPDDTWTTRSPVSSRSWPRLRAVSFQILAPRIAASAIFDANSLIARIASSLPGITKSI